MFRKMISVLSEQSPRQQLQTTTNSPGADEVTGVSIWFSGSFLTKCFQEPIVVQRVFPIQIAQHRDST
jgi:hypothetical protein